MSETLTENAVEKERIESLKKYDILDTPPDGSFDRITKLAATLLGVPIAIVTLVDTDRIWFKSRYGLDVQQIGRDPGLCASAILSNEFYEVDNALTDPRTLSNPLVASEFGLRFYAAVPLKVKDGYNLGTLCIIDKHPRKLSEAEKKTLEYLADILIDQLELRLAARTAIYQQNQVLSIAAHDLKNPLTTISAWADMAKSEKNNPDAVEKMCDRIKEAGYKMNRLVNDLLESARKEASKIQLIFKTVNFAKLVQAVVSSNEILASKKNIKLHLQILDEPIIMGDENRITEIADNLINNSIKYSPSEKNIFITVNKENDNAILIIKDEGQGFIEEDKKNIYQRFVRLSAKPTGGETSTGLGLSIVKSLVDAHNGTIHFESDGKDKGTTFTVSIPVA
ncbi:MAG: GAF domain-containing sensor histidine kinase [Bacteroidota bacterium]|nr:GAF domain-containing sensor histidine kinase [Bacteroidota bacterium]